MFTVLLSVASLSADQEPEGSSRRIALRAERWHAVPEKVRVHERPRQLTIIDQPGGQADTSPPSLFSVQDAERAIRFSVEGAVPDRRTMKWQSDMQALDLPTDGYFVLHYRARGVRRDYGQLSVLALSGKGPDGKATVEPLLLAAQVHNDGLWHTIVGRRESTMQPQQLAVELSTTDSRATFELRKIAFTKQLPAPDAFNAGSIAPDGDAAGFQCISLAGLLNDTCAAAFARVLETEKVVSDGAAALGRGTVRANGVSFLIGSPEGNIAKPDENPAVNAAAVEFLGTKTTRHYVEPSGRDDTVAVPVNCTASEAFFILVAELPKHDTRYAAAPCPFELSDSGGLAIELRYADGDADFAFPYSLADDGFVVKRMVGVYAVPVDRRRSLERFILHNRLFGRTFSVAALTVNVGSARVVPPHVFEPEEPPCPVLTRPGGGAVTVRYEAGRLCVDHSQFSLRFDCRHGFSLESVADRRAAVDTSIDPVSGLAVRHGDKLYTGRSFSTESVAAENGQAHITLLSKDASLPLRLDIELHTDPASPELRLALAATNTGETTLDVDVHFPVLRGVRIGAAADTWLFFPRYRNVNTNRQCTYVAPNDRQFPMQFIDIYSPRAGIGLALLTHNRDNTPLVYAAGKDARGASAHVEHPGVYRPLKPGETTEFTEVCLVAHTGDWHSAFDAYKRWLASWYKPVGAQDKDWFSRIFVMRTHLTRKLYSWAIPIYDAERHAYRLDDFIQADTAYLGTRPDMLHLGGWTDYDNSWRGHPNGDYAVENYTGGTDTLRGLVRDAQDKHRIPVSLYTIPDRCHKQSEVGQRMGESIVRRRADGTAYEDEFNWYICPESQPWQDHYVDALERTQKHTGVRILYVDVFGFTENSRCYASDHGHSVPAQGIRGSLRLIQRIRERLGPDIAIWSEYPLNDNCARFIDGNIHYYCLDWADDYFAGPHDSDGRAPRFADPPLNLYRYAFPRLRQFIFLCGVRNWSSNSTFPFFNGEPLYDTSWFLYASPNLDRMRRSVALQKRYADCFSSASPTPEVQTEQTGLHANAFPGENRTVWTLYNGRFATVRGQVLAVPHVNGATYFDAWNDVPAEVEIIDGRALVTQTLHPQDLGCVVQQR